MPGRHLATTMLRIEWEPKESWRKWPWGPLSSYPAQGLMGSIIDCADGPLHGKNLTVQRPRNLTSLDWEYFWAYQSKSGPAPSGLPRECIQQDVAPATWGFPREQLFLDGASRWVTVGVGVVGVDGHSWGWVSRLSDRQGVTEGNLVAPSPKRDEEAKILPPSQRTGEVWETRHLELLQPSGHEKGKRWWRGEKDEMADYYYPLHCLEEGLLPLPPYCYSYSATRLQDFRDLFPFFLIPWSPSLDLGFSSLRWSLYCKRSPLSDTLCPVVCFKLNQGPFCHLISPGFMQKFTREEAFKGNKDFSLSFTIQAGLEIFHISTGCESKSKTQTWVRFTRSNCEVGHMSS